MLREIPCLMSSWSDSSFGRDEAFLGAFERPGGRATERLRPYDRNSWILLHFIRIRSAAFEGVKLHSYTEPGASAPGGGN